MQDGNESKQWKVYISRLDGPDYNDVYLAIRKAFEGSLIGTFSIVESVEEATDLVIVDLTGQQPDAIYDLGHADALKKSTIALKQEIGDVWSKRKPRSKITYNRNQLTYSLTYPLRDEIIRVLSSPTQIVNTTGICLSCGKGQIPDSDKKKKPPPVSEITQKTPPNVFIGYNEDDEKYLRELSAVLRLYEKSFQVTSPQKILIGQKWKEALEEQIKKADSIIVLLSKNLLQMESNKQKTLLELLEKEKKEGKLIIPLYLNRLSEEHFELWSPIKSASIGDTPLDRIEKEPDRDDIYHNIAEAIKKFSFPPKQ